MRCANESGPNRLLSGAKKQAQSHTDWELFPKQLLVKGGLWPTA
jgi:hypothetical protein